MGRWTSPLHRTVTGEWWALRVTGCCAGSLDAAVSVGAHTLESATAGLLLREVAVDYGPGLYIQLCPLTFGLLNVEFAPMHDALQLPGGIGPFRMSQPHQ